MERSDAQRINLVRAKLGQCMPSDGPSLHVAHGSLSRGHPFCLSMIDENAHHVELLIPSEKKVGIPLLEVGRQACPSYYFILSFD